MFTPRVLLLFNLKIQLGFFFPPENKQLKIESKKQTKYDENKIKIMFVVLSCFCFASLLCFGVVGKQALALNDRPKLNKRMDASKQKKKDKMLRMEINKERGREGREREMV